MPVESDIRCPFCDVADPTSCVYDKESLEWVRALGVSRPEECLAADQLDLLAEAQ